VKRLDSTLAQALEQEFVKRLDSTQAQALALERSIIGNRLFSKISNPM
jgi:hypothetical protein